MVLTVSAFCDKSIVLFDGAVHRIDWQDGLERLRFVDLNDGKLAESPFGEVFIFNSDSIQMPTLGDGFRAIDAETETPMAGDEFFYQGVGEWTLRPSPEFAFDKRLNYRRRIDQSLNEAIESTKVTS